MTNAIYYLLVYLINITLFLPMTTMEKQKIYFLLSDLKPLLQTQRNLIADLTTVTRNKRKALDFIKRETVRFKTEHKKATIDVHRYLKNRVNAFTLVKRMSTDLEYIKNLTEQSSRLTRNKTLKYPTYEDLEEAVRAIVRLRRVYLLNVTQLADGLLETTYGGDSKTFREQSLPMTASDCFEIGIVLCKYKDYNVGMPWLHEALRLYDQEKPRSLLGVTKIDILHAMSKAYDLLDDHAQYIEWTKKLLELKPPFDKDTITDLKDRIDIYQKQKEEGCQLNKKKKQMKQKKEQTQEMKKKQAKAIRKICRLLCRGDMLIEHHILKRLHCWYFVGYHPFSRLAPFKAEQLSIQPEVLLIHGAISDAEIQTIKNIALPELKIIPVHNKSNSSTMYVRLSKGMEFSSRQSESVVPLTQRISDMTGLLATLHPLAVSNYGPGGHYVTHLDSSGSNIKPWIKNSKNMKKEDIEAYIDYTYRISTVLFYISEVERGGATVFPLLGLRVFPSKGAALVWTNLLPTGDADKHTLHGACPVLRGSKWVATKWIAGANQELRKPCAKNYTST